MDDLSDDEKRAPNLPPKAIVETTPRCRRDYHREYYRRNAPKRRRQRLESKRRAGDRSPPGDGLDAGWTTQRLAWPRGDGRRSGSRGRAGMGGMMEVRDVRKDENGPQFVLLDPLGSNESGRWPNVPATVLESYRVCHDLLGDRRIPRVIWGDLVLRYNAAVAMVLRDALTTLEPVRFAVENIDGHPTNTARGLAVVHACSVSGDVSAERIDVGCQIVGFRIVQAGREPAPFPWPSV